MDSLYNFEVQDLATLPRRGRVKGQVFASSLSAEEEDEEEAWRG